MKPRRTLSRGIRNHNPGNIDRRPGIRWQGQAADQSGDPRFVVFEAPKWGIRAIARILITYQDARQAKDGSRIDTVREIIERWAPATENDTGAYVENVARLTGVGADQHIDVCDFQTMKGLVKAIIQHENGSNPYSDAEIEAGLRLAGVIPKPRSLIGQADVAAVATGQGLILLAALTDAVQQVTPVAATTALTIAPIAPNWLKPAFIVLLGLLLGVALLKQIRDHITGARS